MMKKAFIVGIFLLGMFLLPNSALAQQSTTPVDCAAVGGTCKLSCDSGEFSHGRLSCYRGICCSLQRPTAETGGRYPGLNEGCSSTDEINTAIGCIPVGNTNDFLGFFLRWAIGIGGGIAFLLIVLAGFQISTSSGNPERLKAGQELLTSAVAGLIMLIFSVFILRVIGVNILQLPGLN